MAFILTVFLSKIQMFRTVVNAVQLSLKGLITEKILLLDNIIILFLKETTLHIFQTNQCYYHPKLPNHLHSNVIKNRAITSFSFLRVFSVRFLLFNKTIRTNIFLVFILDLSTHFQWFLNKHLIFDISAN